MLVQRYAYCVTLPVVRFTVAGRRRRRRSIRSCRGGHLPCRVVG